MKLNWRWKFWKIENGGGKDYLLPVRITIIGITEIRNIFLLLVELDKSSIKTLIWVLYKACLERKTFVK